VTDLATLAPSLRNMIARPGTFTTLFPETTSADLLAVLADGLAECHLEGLLTDYEADDLGVVSPDLDSGQQALVLLFSGARLIRAELLNRASASKYVAGPVSSEEQYSAQLLRDILAEMTSQKKRIIDNLSTMFSTAGTAFSMADQYVARTMENGLVYEVTGVAEIGCI
jgi:hypothetical protein